MSRRLSQQSNRRTLHFGRFFLVLVVIYLAGLFIHARLVMWNLGQDLQSAHMQEVQLQASNRAMQGQIKNLQRNSYVARLAEQRLGLVKPGEVSYIVRRGS